MTEDRVIVLLPLLPMDVTLDVLSLADILASQRSVATKQPATAQLTLRRKLWLVDTNDIPQCFTLLLGQVIFLMTSSIESSEA